MIKIAHASKTDALKNHMKRLRAQRSKNRHKEQQMLAEMSEEERKAYLNKKDEKSIGGIFYRAESE